MDIPQWLGVPLGVLMIAFIFFAFRQGNKVTRRQEGDPPDRSGSGFGY
jgi:cbb3-type cytochrome oxidase subunit 3